MKLASFLEYSEVQLFVVFKAELWGKGAANPWVSICSGSFGKWSKLASFLEYSEVQLFVVFIAELRGKLVDR